MADLSVAVKIGAEDRFSGAAAKVGGAASKLEKRVSAAQRELGALGKQDAALKKLALLEQRLGKSGTALDAARKRTAALRGELRATASPTKKLSDAFERSRQRSSQLGQAHSRQRERVRKLRGELREAGIDTKRLADAQADLDRKMRGASGRMDQARVAADALAARQAKSAQNLEKFSRASLVAQSAGGLGRSALHALTAPVQGYRGVAAARGDLQSLGLDPAAAKAIADRGRDVSLRIPGVSAEGFTLAAYDIQSGIEGLSTEGLAGLTEASAVTARATKGEVTDMTGLMATLHSVFKDALHEGMSDSEFGWAAAGQLSEAVRQFKTTGPRMQQAIQSAGSKLALSGVSMAEQFAALGLLQGKMEPGKAGTALDAFARTAANAEGKLADSGRSVRLLDEGNNLLPLTQAMANLRQAFGEDLTTKEQAELGKAFGSEEAAEAIAALWKLGDDQAAAVAALEAAGSNGEQVARGMQARRDDNAHDRLKLLGQRWDNLMLTAGESLVGALERLAPHFETLISGLEWMAEEWPDFTSGLIVFGGAVAALTYAAGVAAPSIVALAWAATKAAALWGRLRGPGLAPQSLGPGGAPAPRPAGKPLAGAPGRGRFGRLLDGGRGIASRVPALGKLGRLAPVARTAARFGGRAVPFLPTALGAVELGGAVFDRSAPAEQRSERIASAAGGVAGGLGGALAGAKLGALVGTAVFPGAGTAIGAALGGVVGGVGGDALGRALASWLHGESAPEAAPAPDPASFVGPQPATASGGNHVSIDSRINIYQRPGEDSEALARRVMDELDRLRGEAEREAAFDAS